MSQDSTNLGTTVILQLVYDPCSYEKLDYFLSLRPKPSKQKVSSCCSFTQLAMTPSYLDSGFRPMSVLLVLTPHIY